MGVNPAPSYVDVVQLILSAYRTRPPGFSNRFMLADGPGRRSSIGVELFRDLKLLRRAALIMFGLEPLLLENETVSHVITILDEFFTSSTYLIDNNCLIAAIGKDVSVAEVARPEAPIILAQALKGFLQNKCAPQLHIAPVNRVPLESDLITSDAIFVRAHPQLDIALAPLGMALPLLNGTTSPPYEFGGRLCGVGVEDCWVGCVAGSENAASSKLRRIQGAFSLILPPSQAKLFGDDGPLFGKVTVRPNGQVSFGTRRSIFPTLINMPTISAAMLSDAENLIGTRVVSGEIRRRLNVALEFVAGSWVAEPRLSFLQNAVAFDALFGVQGNVKNSIISAVSKFAGSIPAVSDRIGRLLKIRNALLHGEIASIEEALDYRRYFEEFDIDPIEDQRTILRKSIFGQLGQVPAAA